MNPNRTTTKHVTLSAQQLAVIAGNQENPAMYRLSPGLQSQVTAELNERLQSVLKSSDIDIKLDPRLRQWESETAYVAPPPNEWRNLIETPTFREVMSAMEVQLRESGIVPPSDFEDRWREATPVELHIMKFGTHAFLRAAPIPASTRWSAGAQVWTTDRIAALAVSAGLATQRGAQEKTLEIEEDTPRCVAIELSRWLLTTGGGSITYEKSFQRVRYTQEELIWIALQLNTDHETAFVLLTPPAELVRRIIRTWLAAGPDGSIEVEELFTNAGWCDRDGALDDYGPRVIMEAVIACGTPAVPPRLLRAALLHHNRSVRLLGIRLAGQKELEALPVTEQPDQGYVPPSAAEDAQYQTSRHR